MRSCGKIEKMSPTGNRKRGFDWRRRRRRRMCG
jgi:hypothetical protein